MLSFSGLFTETMEWCPTFAVNTVSSVILFATRESGTEGDLIVGIDKQKIKKLEKSDHPAPMDEVEERVDAEMKLIEGKAKEEVAKGLANDELARKGRKMKEDAEGELKGLREKGSRK